MTCIHSNRAMRAGAALLGLVLGACSNFDAPNQNFSTLAELTEGTPSRVAVGTAAQGLLGSVTGTNAGLRNIFGTNASTLGILGREGYNLDVSNPQNIPTFYSTPAGNNFKNLTYWTGAYATMLQADIVMTAADAALGMTAAEREATKGFAETIKALELFYVIRQTDVSGAALDALTDPTADPPPIVGKAAVYTEILRLLDDARVHLLAGGTAFPFSLTTGFAGFTTPNSTFLQFNRAIRAKVNVTNNQFAAALTDLTASFINAAAPMSTGVYHTFSTLSGDTQNGLYDPTARQRYAHRQYADSAQLKTAGGVRDDRFTSKIDTLVPEVQRYDFTVDYRFKIYGTNTTPAVIIKNEELLLLRAEANINLGGLANNSAAIADINIVRAASGGLPAITDPYVPNVALKQPGTGATNPLLEELLYEKRYSLMWENGDRWIDMRRYGRLASIAHDRPATAGHPADIVWPYLMIIVNECLPRNPAPAGCTAVPPTF